MLARTSSASSAPNSGHCRAVGSQGGSRILATGGGSRGNRTTQGALAAAERCAVELQDENKVGAARRTRFEAQGQAMKTGASMLDDAIRTSLLIVVGIALGIAVIWYVRFCYQEIRGTGQVVIEPLTVVDEGGKSNDQVGKAL